MTVRNNPAHFLGATDWIRGVIYVTTLHSRLELRDSKAGEIIGGEGVTLSQNRNTASNSRRRSFRGLAFRWMRPWISFPLQSVFDNHSIIRHFAVGLPAWDGAGNLDQR